MTWTDQNQIGQRQQTVNFHLTLSLSICLLQHVSKLNDIPTGTETVPRSTIKVKKWAVAQFIEIPTPSPKRLEFSSHSLAHEITHPYKNWQISTVGPLCPFEMAHTAVEHVSPSASHLLRWPILCGVCLSRNKSISYLSLCLTLNSLCNETSRLWAAWSPEARDDLN